MKPLHSVLFALYPTLLPTVLELGLYVLTVKVYLFQNVIPAEVSLVCVVKPDEFWDKKVTHFCFWKEKDRLGFEVSPLMTALLHIKPAFRISYTDFQAFNCVGCLKKKTRDYI